MSPKRRDVLRAGGVAALLSGGLAGCIEDVTESSGGETPAYADWLFDTDTLLETSFRGFYAADVSAYRERRAALPESTNRIVQRAAEEYDGVAVEDFDRVTGLGAHAPRDGEHEDRFLLTTVGTGDFDAESVASAIEANAEVTAAGSYEGYDLYLQRDRHRPSFTGAAAVSEEAVVLAIAEAGGDYRSGRAGETPPSPSGTPTGGVSALAAAKRHIDAAAGGADRLLPASDRLAALADALDGPIVGGLAVDDATLRERFGLRGVGDGTGTPRPEPDGRDGEDNGGGDGSSGTPTPPPTPTVSDPEPSPIPRHLSRVTRGLTAFGGSADASGASSGEVVFRLLYGSESAASDGATAVRDLRDALRAEVDAFTVPEVEVTTDGAAVAITITGDPSAFYDELGFGGRDEPQRRAPQVSFSFERREDGRITVTHDGGDEVGTDGRIRLLYESDGERVDRRWQPEDGSITAGDSITTERPVSDVLRVVWESAEGDASATLGLYRPPEPDGDQVPRVAFDFDVRSDGRITITHEGGDTVEQPLIVVYRSDEGGRKEVWEPDDGTISAGETYTTESPLAADGALEVIWEGESTATLAQFHATATPSPRQTRTASAEDTSTSTPRERSETGTATPREATETRTATPQGTGRETPTRTPTATESRTSTGTETSTPTPVEDGTPTTN